MEFLILAALLGALILSSAFFSAMETAFFSLQPGQLRRMENRVLAADLERLLANPRRLLSALLLADAFVNLPLILLSLFTLREAVPAQLPFWACTLAVFAVVVILCDLLPKAAALRAPLGVAALGVRPLGWLLPVLDPACRRLQRASEKVANRLTPKALDIHQPLDEEELGTLIELNAEEGALRPEESEIIQEILKLGEKTARDCMTPRTDMFAIPDDLTNDEARARLREQSFRRVPVFADTPDNILGLLDVQRFLLTPGLHFTEQLTPPSYVSETMKALDLLHSFLTHPQRLAVVVDEFGGTEGVVSLPDLVEQIISDAIPSADEGLYIENAGDHRLIVAGNARLDDLGERVGIDLETEGIDTIGGLIFNQLGALPRLGETVEIKGLRFTIQRATSKRIQEMLVEIPPAPAAPLEEEEEEGEA
ncbi:MAG: hemolysin family protein [Chthoniobacteraceae bacterium]|nr:hemolysin family protein [Chthoniobacteraceae bacterium]